MVNAIKEIATNVLQSQNFSSFYKGSVVSDSPLTIALEDGLSIDETFIILSKAVTDYEEVGEIELKVCDEQELQWYEYKINHKKALEVGDEVAVVKENGGQRYLVIDRLAVDGGEEV